MKIEKIICDCCGEEIPKVKKKDVFGIEREYYRMGKLNYGEPFTDINCQKFGLDLYVSHVSAKNAEDTYNMERTRNELLINNIKLMKGRG